MVLPWVPATTRTSFAAQKFFVQDLRQRAERNALVENVFQFNVAARNRVSHHHHIWPRIEIGGRKRLGHRNIQRSQEVRHGRICSRVRAGHAKTALLEHAGQGRHGGAANADQVYMPFIAHNSCRHAGTLCVLRVLRGYFRLPSSRRPRGNCGRRGCFQYFKADPAGRDAQRRLHAERQSDVATRHMSGS